MRARALALVAALAAPAAASAAVRPTWGGTLHVALPAPPHAADAGSPGDLLVARATSAPLLELDARGRLRPGVLAEVPAPEADGRAFRLRVRPDVVDAAGRRLGAADVAARLTELLQGGAGAPAGFVALPVAGADAVLDGRARALAGVRVVSATEVLVTLAFPLPQFPLLLAAAPAGLPAAGPFSLAGPAAPGAPLRLVRNDRYFEGRPFLDAVELHARDARVSARLLEKGEVELVLRPEAAGARGAALPALTVTVAAVNPRLGAAAEPLRRALAGVDRGELAQRFVRGAAEPLATLVPPALLAGAPPPAPSPGRASGPLPQRVVLVADAAAADQRALAERLQVKLFDRGVRVALELVDGEARLRARLAAGDWDAALVPVTVLAPDAVLAAGQIAWAARGLAAGQRALAELAPLAGDPAALAAAVDRLGRELGIVPLVASGLRASAGAALEGLEVRPDGAVDAASLWLLGGAR